MARAGQAAQVRPAGVGDHIGRCLMPVWVGSRARSTSFRQRESRLWRPAALPELPCNKHRGLMGDLQRPWLVESSPLNSLGYISLC